MSAAVCAYDDKDDEDDVGEDDNGGGGGDVDNDDDIEDNGANDDVRLSVCAASDRARDDQHHQPAPGSHGQTTTPASPTLHSRLPPVQPLPAATPLPDDPAPPLHRSPARAAAPPPSHGLAGTGRKQTQNPRAGPAVRAAVLHAVAAQSGRQSLERVCGSSPSYPSRTRRGHKRTPSLHGGDLARGAAAVAGAE